MQPPVVFFEDTSDNTPPVSDRVEQMLVVFYVESGCLGPDGQNRIELFCKKFTPFIKSSLGMIGDMEIKAIPRRNNAEEFLYTNEPVSWVPLDAASIDKSLEEIMLTRDEFEQGLSELALEYIDGPEWQQLLKEHFE